jgi:Predicted membrane protein
MEGQGPATGGLLGSVRGLIDSVLFSARERLELFSLELREEKLRAIQLFVWVCAAVFAGIMAITFASLAIVYLFWETARLAVLIGFAVVYAGGFVAILRYCRKLISQQPRPFDATIAELTQDRACIRKEN